MALESRSRGLIALGALLFLLGGVFGAARLMPIAGHGMTAQPWEEILVGVGLVIVTVTMILGCSFLVWGLFRSR